MTFALPGTLNAPPRPKPVIPARQPRHWVAEGLVCLSLGLATSVAYSWIEARPGEGDFSVSIAALLVAALSSALVAAGMFLAVHRDAPRLSRIPLSIVLVIVVLLTTFAGREVLFRRKFAGSEAQLSAAAARELAAKPATTASPSSYCTPAVDPAAFAAFVRDAEVCGYDSPRNPTLIIRMPSPEPIVRGRSWYTRGLLYAPVQRPSGTNACLKQISDAWWEYSALIDGVSCPSGMAFDAGG